VNGLVGLPAPQRHKAGLPCGTSKRWHAVKRAHFVTALFVFCAAQYSKLHVETSHRGAGMNSPNNLRAINPSLDELLAAYDAFEELPTMEALSRLVMIRRAVTVGFFNDDVPSEEQSSLSATRAVA
jgi:hypothetical protein